MHNGIRSLSLPTKSKVVCTTGYEVCLSLQNLRLYAQRDTMFVSPYKIWGCMHNGILCLSLPTKSKVVCTTGYEVCLSLQNLRLYAQRDAKFVSALRRQFPQIADSVTLWQLSVVISYYRWEQIRSVEIAN